MVDKDRQRWDDEFRQYKRNLQIAEEDEIFNYQRRYGQEEPDEFDQDDRDYKTLED